MESSQVVGSGVLHEFVAQGAVAVNKDNEFKRISRIGAAAFQLNHKMP